MRRRDVCYVGEWRKEKENVYVYVNVYMCIWYEWVSEYVYVCA